MSDLRRAVCSLTIVLASLFCPAVSVAASVPAPQWFSSFSPAITGNGFAQASALLADGTTMVIGANTAIRYNAALSAVSSVPIIGACRGDNYAIDHFGNFVVLSYTADSRFTAMKCNGFTGDTEWIAPTILGDPGFEPGRNALLPIVFDRSGDVFVAAKLQQGTVNVSSEHGAYIVAKLDGSTGALRWPAVSIPVAIESQTGGFITLDGNGDLLVTGYSISDFPPFPRGAFVAKISGGTGQVLWGPLFDDPDTGPPLALIADGSGNVFWLTYSKLARIDGGSGKTVWQRLGLGGLAGDTLHPSAIAESASGAIFVGGVDGNFSASVGLVDPRDGSLIYGPVPFDDAAQHEPTDIRFDALGNPVVTNSLSSSPEAIFDLDRFTGAVRWSVSVAGALPFQAPPLTTSDGRLFAMIPSAGSPPRFEHPESIDPTTGAEVEGADFQPSLAWAGAALPGLIESDGDPVVATNGWSLEIRRFDHAAGGVLWEATLSNEFGSSVALDGAGDVAVIHADRASLSFPNPSAAWSVDKLDAGDGHSVWSTLFDANVLSNTRYPAVCVDGSGNVIATGRLSGAWKTAKLDATDGHVIWSQEIVDSDPTSLFPVSISPETDGDVVVAGFEGRIARLSGTDGSVIWTKTVPNVGSATPTVSIDANGDVGAFVVSADSTAQLTKLDGSDGAVLWGPVTIPSTYSSTALLLGPSNDWIAVGSAFVDPLETWSATRFRSSDGTVVWGPVLQTSPYGVEADGAGYDANGDVLVLGCAYEAWTGCHAAVSGLDVATGSDLWGALTIDGFHPEPFDRPYAAGAAPGGFVVLGASNHARWTTRLGSGLSIEQKDLSPAICGVAFTQTLNVFNATGTPQWTITSGALPSGLALSTDGVVSGTPLEEGAFLVTIQVQSGAATATADYVMSVFRPDPEVVVQTSASPVCPGTTVTLSVPGTYDSYLWLPGGETTPTIEVTPEAPTVYGVIVGSSGCHQQGSILVDTGFGAAPTISAPASAPPQTTGLVASTPDTGASYSWSIENGTLTSGSTGAQITFDSGAPGSVIRLTLDATRGDACVSDPSQFLVPVDFLDVPPSNIFHDYVDAIERSSVTNGCGNGRFCPNALISREQMAAFLARAIVGVPPVSGEVTSSPYNCSAGGSSLFVDVSPTSIFCSSIHYIASRKITIGCTAPGSGPSKFCPLADVTREQMALFIGRAIAPSATPPSAYSDGTTGRSYDCSVASPFPDVAANTETCNGVGYIWAKGIVDGFGDGTFHPKDALTRAPAAKFIANAFGLTLGP